MSSGSPPPRPTLQQLARKRIKLWLMSTGATQGDVGARIGRNQAWMSRYLGGDIDADVETLRQFAEVFGHTLSALLESPTDPDEAKILDAYRALSPESRDLALRLLEHLGRPPRGRGRGRG